MKKITYKYFKDGKFYYGRIGEVQYSFNSLQHLKNTIYRYISKEKVIFKRTTNKSKTGISW